MIKLEYRKITVDKLIVKANNFKLKHPDIVSINFDVQTVTVLDSNEKRHSFPLSEVELGVVIESNEPL
jgi:hypothetical protein